jgi:hypothetical protein
MRMYLKVDAILSSLEEWNNVLRKVSRYAGTFGCDPGIDPGPNEPKSQMQHALNGGARGAGPSHEHSPCKTAASSETQVPSAFRGEGQVAIASSQPKTILSSQKSAKKSPAKALSKASLLVKFTVMFLMANYMD